MTFPPPPPRVPLPLRTIVATAALTLGAAAVGQLDWPLPDRVSGGWQVAAVPASLTALVLVCTGICLAVGAATTARDAGLRLRDLAVWAVVVLLAAAGLVWNALVLAADAAVVVGALIPIFHWAFTFVPGLVAGLAARRRRPATTLAVALGTGVVTVPLFALGFSLFASREAFLDGIAWTLWITVILGVLPLALAALITKNLSNNRAARFTTQED